MVRVCGRPINIVPESLSFDIDTNHWISFPNKKALFPWRGTVPEGWKFKPIPNQNSPKFVCVSGLLAGISTEGTSKRFQVDIMLVTFLGSAPPAYATQSEYSALQSTTPTDFSCSTGEGETEGRDKLRRQAHPHQETPPLNYRDKFRTLRPS